MGYTTEFEGKVTVEPPLSLPEYQFYKGLAEHDQRDKGDFKVPNAPGNFCQWEPSADGTSFAWDGNEKFYDSLEWMQFLVKRLAAAGHTCNGQIDAQGEEMSDRWRIVVRDNVVQEQRGKISFE